MAIASEGSPSQWLKDAVKTLIDDMTGSEEVSLESAEAYMTRIELLYREMLLVELEYGGALSDLEMDVMVNLSQAFNCICQLVQRLSVAAMSEPASGPALVSGQVGRPSFYISTEQLQYLIDLQFSVPQIAQLVGVSVRTIRRRMSEAGLSIRSTYSQLSNDQLDGVIAGIQQQFPNCGYRQMYGHLVSQGIRVQYYRVRDSQRRIDPEGTVLRQLRCINRRTYSVQGPQHLWHIDGNHKLIRWKMIIHGGIDGYSRLIIYLRCANNNRSDTVMTSFLEAIQIYGVPKRVRADRGTENVQVCEYMNRVCGRRTFIAGRSVHNQRIERLWRDVFSSVLLTFYNLFYDMEDSSLLDLEDPVQLFALHYVYTHRINRSLSQFVSAWNNHPLSSVSSATPYQLWLTLTLRTVPEGNIEQFGIDWDGPLPSDLNSAVDVDPPDMPLSYEHYEELCTSVNPLEECDDFGIDIYMKTVRFILDHI